MKNKRGNSPLVATVLLVAIVIIIAILLWFWYHNFIEEQQQKASTELAQACMNAEIRVEDALCSGNVVDIEIANIGTSQITSLLFNGLFDDGSQAFETGDPVPAGATTGLLQIEFDNHPGETLDRVEIIPVVMIGGQSKYCNDQKQYSSC